MLALITLLVWCCQGCRRNEGEGVCSRHAEKAFCRRTRVRLTHTALCRYEDSSSSV